jgi:hypothetical protein
MRYQGLALILCFGGGLLVLFGAPAQGQIPSWLDNNPANAPRLGMCGPCCAVPAYAAAPAPKAHRCALVEKLKACRLACLGRRYQRHAAHACGSVGCGGEACGCGGCEGNGCGCGACGGGCSDCGACDHGHAHGDDYEAGGDATYEGPAMHQGANPRRDAPRLW